MEGGGEGDETAATSLGFGQGRPQSPLVGWHPHAGQHTKTSRGFYETSRTWSLGERKPEGRAGMASGFRSEKGCSVG